MRPSARFESQPHNIRDCAAQYAETASIPNTLAEMLTEITPRGQFRQFSNAMCCGATPAAPTTVRIFSVDFKRP
jgi:hypothetical protein